MHTLKEDYIEMDTFSHHVYIGAIKEEDGQANVVARKTHKISYPVTNSIWRALRNSKKGWFRESYNYVHWKPHDNHS